MKKIKEYFKKRRQFYKAVHELQSLSDQELNDIGISRGMIYEVAKGE